ncbi:MAG: response regulator transcription factor [Betaproteobacteria bacterium]|nr:response regulator transcription factor [Betaproteobacteria bacterium]
MKLRVLIVDDNYLFRKALRHILERDPELEVVAEAGDGLEALAKASKVLPDVVCMDIRMPGVNGIETTRRLVAARPTLKVIGLSAHAEVEYVLGMLEAGASGYVTKRVAGKELASAIRTVRRGETYICAELAKEVAAARRTETVQAPFSASPLDACEREILRLLSEKVDPKEIAEQYCMTPYLLEAYRRNIMRKLGLHSDAEFNEYLKG